jgi:hypothetical protein
MQRGDVHFSVNNIAEDADAVTEVGYLKGSMSTSILRMNPKFFGPSNSAESFAADSASGAAQLRRHACFHKIELSSVLVSVDRGLHGSRRTSCARHV